MKVKTSVTLSEELLSIIDKKKDFSKKSRSEFIEKALWNYIKSLLREEQNQKDLQIINKYSSRLNKEAKDVLEYQVSL